MEVEMEQIISSSHEAGYKKGYRDAISHIQESIMNMAGKEDFIEYIEGIVCRYFGVVKKELETKSRKTTVRFPRQIIMYLLKKYANISLVKIGERYGGRDHTTVIAAKDAIKDMMDTDEIIKQLIEGFESQIKIYCLKNSHKDGVQEIL